MTYKLLIGQRLYSSWSLRGWLPFVVWNIPVTVRDTVIYSAEFHDEVAAFGGHRLVPVAHTPTGGVLNDSIAIAWHLAQAYPDDGLLPRTPNLQAQAQSLIAEMHSGFTALRSACPMNLATAWEGFAPDAAVQADLARIDAVWSKALDASGGPYLFGDYSLADVFFAPVAVRIAGYQLPVSKTARSYVSTHLSHPALQTWRKDGLAKDQELAKYDMPLRRIPFPMPANESH